MKLFGIVGTGIAFFVLYIIYTGMIWLVVRHISGFRWTLVNCRTSGMMILFIVIVFSLPAFLPKIMALIVSVLLIAAVGFYCMRKLYHLVGLAWFSEFGDKLKNHLG